MKHWMVAVAAGVVLLAGNWSISIADDGESAKPAAAQPADAAPADGAAVGGCMPGGGCCGTCAEKAAAQEKAAGAEAEGGCPCKRNKQKPES